jgi:hypothetical protein
VTPLVDSFGRLHNNLRISVTDRCNIRCFYRMPKVAPDLYHVFHNPGSRGSRQIRQLEAMPMKVNWMNVIAGIAHVDSIPLAFFQMKRTWRHFIFHLGKKRR